MSRPTNPDEIDLFEDDLYNNSSNNEESNNELEVAEDTTMAETLGFTSFGGTRPIDDHDDNKRRRFNPHLDNAVIATTNEEPQLTAYRAQAHPNKRQKLSASPRDEITYSDSDDYASTNTNTNAANNNGTPTGAPSGHPPDSHYPSQQQRPPTGPRRGNYSPRGGNRGGGNWGGGGRGGGYNSNYNSSYNNNYNNNNNRNNNNSSNRGGGPVNPLWYVEYYDPASNENPWEGMEKYKRLPPVGTWLSRGRKRARDEEVKGGAEEAEGGDGDGAEGDDGAGVEGDGAGEGGVGNAEEFDAVDDVVGGQEVVEEGEGGEDAEDLVDFDDFEDV